MAVPTRRLERRVRSDFGEDAAFVLEALRDVPENLPLCGQDPERMQAAIVMTARADLDAFGKVLDLAALDWRDLLMNAGLGSDGWAAVLDRELGSA